MRKLKCPSIKEMVQRRIDYHTRMIAHYEECEAACIMDGARISKAMNDANLSCLADIAVVAVLRKKQVAIDSAEAHRESLSQLQKQADQYGITH